MKIKPEYLKIAAIEFIVATAVLLLSVFLFSYIADEVVTEKVNLFDNYVFGIIEPNASTFFTNSAQLVTNFGTGYFLIPAYLFIIFYLIKNKKKREATVVSIIALVSLISGWAFKDIFHRHRPGLPLISGAGGYSFPSGHALGGFTFSGILIFLIWRSPAKSYLKWILSFFLVLFAILIGLSRIYLHVHFASDVLGSLLLAIIWLTLTYLLLAVKDSNLKHSSS